MKKVLIVLVLLAAAATGVYWGRGRFYDSKPEDVQYRLARVERRDMVNSVSATGELSAVVTVVVGSEISGQIKELLVDYNSQVKKGDIIARLDPQSYETLLRQAEAELALAQAQLLTRKADVVRSRADLQNVRDLLDAAQAQTAKARATSENAERDLKRKEALVKQEFVSRNDFDAAKTAFKEARAQLDQAQAQENAARSKVASSQASLKIAQAQIMEAEAQIRLKQAALEKRQVDLTYTIIRSPVDGVVIDRSVDVGQIVAASLQAPTLFTIAQDLRNMQVSASVDEADIGQIREGEPAHFTVDAYPNRTFNGQVSQIRKAGKTVQNVVTYTVIISADNSDQKLMPGMTADVEIEVMKKPQVLAVESAALRFKPQSGKEALDAGAGAASGNAPQATFQSGSGPGADPEERIRRLGEALDLTPEQRQHLKEVFRQMGDKIRNAREAPGFMPQSRSAMRDKMRKEIRNAIIQILTPEQRQRYEQIARTRSTESTPQGVIWRLNADKQPEAIPVRIGLSDNRYTEIASPQITAGMEVIVGIR